MVISIVTEYHLNRVTVIFSLPYLGYTVSLGDGKLIVWSMESPPREAGYVRTNFEKCRPYSYHHTLVDNSSKLDFLRPPINQITH